MSFHEPWAWVIGPILGLFYLFSEWRQAKSYQLIGYRKLLSSTQTGVGRQWWWLKLIRALLALSAISFLTYALMGPRVPNQVGESQIDILDLFLVVDVSRSMLADDIAPNRLEAAKKRLREFAALKPRDRFGVILFSEKVFTLLPLTIDPEMLQQVIGDIQIGFLGSGTNIGDALALAIARLQITETKTKVIVLLTDGVSNVGNMTPLQAAEEAKKLGVKIYAIGFGTTSEDAKIPTGRNAFGNMGYQGIPGGSVDYDALKDVAKMTGGKFYEATSDQALGQVFTAINTLERSQTKASGMVSYEELFWWPLLWGILCWMLHWSVKYFVLKERW